MTPNASADRLVTGADSARSFLVLTRLLDDVERQHPEISAPLRLTLHRAHRDHGIGWIDAVRFEEVARDLAAHAAHAARAT